MAEDRAEGMGGGRVAADELRLRTSPEPLLSRMRHLIPHFRMSKWVGEALTRDPDGCVELPPGLMRNVRIAFGQPTTAPQHDEVTGSTLCIQWLGLMVEIAFGRVR